jgi:integrase
VEVSPGRWKYTVWVKRENGSRVQRSKTIHGSKTDAKRALSATLHEVQCGAFSDDDGLTFASLVGRFLAAKTLSREPTTVALYKRTLEHHVLPVIGHLRVRDVKAAHVQRVLDASRNRSKTNRQGQRLNSTSLRNLRTYVRAVLAYAVKQGLLARNVGDLVEVPVQVHCERPEITLDIVRTILTAAAGTEIESLVLFALATGARRGEMCALRWSDIDLATGAFTIRRAAKNVGRHVIIGNVKTRKSLRSDILPQFGLDSLRHYRLAQSKRDLSLGFGNRGPDAYVFDRADGTPWNPNELSKAFSKFARRHELPGGLRLHDLRHGFATLAFASGSSLKVVSESLGHSNVAVTSAIYIHILEDAKRQKSERLDAYLGPALYEKASGQ